MPAEEPRTDKALLAAYVADGDEKAFAEIVERHGPMVYRVCYRILRDHHACEDAVQAVFAILVKKARSIRRRGSVSSWLHGTARNVALYQLRQTIRKRKREEMFAMYDSITKDADAVDETTRKAVVDALDSAVAGLSARQREAVVLRYLQGRSVEESAAVAGCSEDALRRRASDGLGKLRKRLSRRGLAVGAGALAAILAGEAQATVPTALMSSIVTTSQAVAAGAATGAVSSSVVNITEGVMKMMFLSQIKTAGLAALATLMVAVVATQTISRADDNKAAAPAADVQQDEVEEAKKLDINNLSGKFVRLNEAGQVVFDVVKVAGDSQATPPTYARVTIEVAPGREEAVAADAAEFEEGQLCRLRYISERIEDEEAPRGFRVRRLAYGIDPAYGTKRK